MFCSSCFVDNEEGLERCASCGEVLLPPLSDGPAPPADTAAAAPAAPAAEAAPSTPPEPPPAPPSEPAPARPAATGSGPASASPAAPDPGGGKRERRTQPRLEIPVNLLIRQPASEARERREEQTIGENISRGGVRVMTSWTDLSEGDQVLLTEIGGDFETRAEVRGKWTGDDRVPRLNLSFLDREAPERLAGAAPDEDGSAPPKTSAEGGGGGAKSEAPAEVAQPRRLPGGVAAAAAAAAPRPGDGGATAAEVAERQALRDEVLSTFQSLPKASHYELLGIPRSADAQAIRSAYAQRARKFHPDRATRDLGDLRDAFQVILVKLGEARDVLVDPGQRGYYDAHLPSPSAPAAAAGTDERAAPSRNSEADAVMAEKVIAQARKLFESEKYWDTIQLLETHLPQVESEKLKLTMRVLWARATAQNPRWLRRAEETLLEIIKDHPRHVEAHFELGRIYSAGGLTTRAQRMYRTVLELDPSHEGAAAALNSLLTTRKL